jgi:hypothetical protein
MKIHQIFARPSRSRRLHHLPMLLCCLALFPAAQAQKAYPVSLTQLLGSIPIPQSSAACYATSTIEKDPSNGAVTVKDNGATFSDLNAKIMKISMAGMTTAPTAGSMSSPPSAEQIEQMKQQAMQRAAQAQQGMTPQQAYSGSATAKPMDPDLMRQVGQAQNTIGPLNQLTSELSAKISQLDKGLDKVRQGPNCPEVQQGGYAGPTCSCLIARGTAYANARAAQEDLYLKKVTALLTDYISKIKVQLAIVDAMEAKTRYGDAIANPMFKQQPSMIQRQAMASITTVLSIASSVWTDAAAEHANVVNATNGTSEGCAGKK